MFKYSSSKSTTINSKSQSLRSNFPLLIGSVAAISCSLTVATPASAFDLYRGDENPTEFHTTTYNNGLTGADAFQQFVNTEYQAIDMESIEARQLDTNSLFFQNDHDVNVYFLNEGAWFRNQLAVTSTGSSDVNGIVFNDGSCLQSDCNFIGYDQRPGILNEEDALRIGDYVSLGNVQAGTNLEFSLRRNGFHLENTDVWYGKTSKNSDGLQHLMAYEYENYLILAWEDIKSGGDLDYNDVVFAVDVGKVNLANIPTAGTPEPLTILGSILAGVTGFLGKTKGGFVKKKLH